MPQTRTRYVAKCRNQDTGALTLFTAPLGIVPVPGDAAHPLAWLWQTYTGSTGSLINCVTPPGPVVGAPVWLWTGNNIPDLIPGQVLELRIPLSALTPGGSEHIVETGVVAKPDWISFFYDENGVEVRLYGIVPASGTLNLTLYGKQSGTDGLRTNQVFTKVISAPNSVYALSVYRTVTKRLTIDVGADGTGVPTISLLYAPTGYNKGSATLMDRLATPDSFNNLSYPFAFNFNGIVSGTYIGKIVWLGQTRYFRLDVVDKVNLAATALTLSTTYSLPQAGSPIYDNNKETFVVEQGVNPAPFLLNPQPDVLITAAGPFTIPPPVNEFGDNPNDTGYVLGYKYDGGSNSELPLPLGITYDVSTGVFSGTADFPNQAFILRRKYIDSALQFSVDDFLLTVNRTTTPSLVINRMSVYLPLGWHDNSFGNLSENIVLLLNVSGGSSATPVQAQYVQSRNDATFGNMQPLNYANNSGPNTLPAGFTHYTMFNDETFSTGLKTFRAKLTNVANSQVEATYLANASYADHTTTQIYPTTN